MPLTSYQPERDSSSSYNPYEVTAELPIMESGHIVAWLNVTVNAAYDGAFKEDPYHASDVSFDDVHGNRQPFSQERGHEILARIRSERKSEWAQIEAAATARTNPTLAA